MTLSPYPSRLNQLQELLSKSQLDAIVLNPGPDLTYLTGLSFHLMERPVLAIFPASGSAQLVLPELEGQKLVQVDYEILPFPYNEDTSTWVPVIKSALDAAGLAKGRLGVIPNRLRLLEYNYLQQAGPGLEIVSGQQILEKMRMHKSEAEVELMAEAARIAECALASTLPSIKPGITEKQLESRLVGRLLHQGSDSELPFFPIVSFGENAANPHAAPSDRALRKGDLVLIDWGASYQAYFSDITRTFAMGDINPELEQIAAFVREANAAGRAAVKPGLPASEVDRVTRQVITQAGYGEYFTHRTGHGLGREAHEEPYISAFSQTILEPGMTFTIEPGIYLPGRGGVRIEDNVVVTKDGCRSLTNFPRELSQLEIDN